MRTEAKINNTNKLTTFKKHNTTPSMRYQQQQQQEIVIIRLRLCYSA